MGVFRAICGARSPDPSPDDPRAAAEALLAEVLPLDLERLAEAEVWAALCARALVDGTLSRLRDLADDGLRGLCGQVVTGLTAAALVGTGVDLDLETERLHALVDGLTLHAVMRPAQMAPELVAAVLRRHLDALTAPLPPAS